MWNEECPRSILLTILQCKFNIGSKVDLNEAAEITPLTDHGIGGDNIVPNHIDNDIDDIVTPQSHMTPDMNDLLEK